MSGYLLASDFDGTLIHWPEGKPDERDRDAIRRFREAGNRFAVVTGRSYWNAVGGFDYSDFHDMDCFLCMSGAYCAKPDETPIYEKRMSTKRLPEIIEFFKEQKARYLSFDIGTKSYSLDIGAEVMYSEVLDINDAMKFPEFTSLNAGAQNENRATEIIELLKLKFPDVITPLQNQNCIDMPPAGINKAVGCRNIAEIFGIDEDNIYTAGDSYNDMDMIVSFHGNAMDTGLKALMDAAECKVHRLYEIIDRIMRG